MAVAGNWIGSGSSRASPRPISCTQTVTASWTLCALSNIINIVPSVPCEPSLTTGCRITFLRWGQPAGSNTILIDYDAICPDIGRLFCPAAMPHQPGSDIQNQTFGPRVEFSTAPRFRRFAGKFKNIRQSTAQFNCRVAMAPSSSQAASPHGGHRDRGPKRKGRRRASPYSRRQTLLRAYSDYQRRTGQACATGAIEIAGEFSRRIYTEAHQRGCPTSRGSDIPETESWALRGISPALDAGDCRGQFPSAP
jgi:hypothetical protein